MKAPFYNVKALTPIHGLVSMQEYVNIRYADLQAARYRMTMLRSHYYRRDMPVYWSQCRKALNTCQHAWDEIKGKYD